MAAADVVYFDRLGPTEDLPQLAPRATFVDVGKTPGHHKVGQADITARIIADARNGLQVLRLKGGDPFVFGRGGNGLRGGRGHPRDCDSGDFQRHCGPGRGRHSLTHRNVSHLFTVVSGHAPLTTNEYSHLAGLGGTIVVLMGMGTLPSLVAGLLVAGLHLAGLAGCTRVAVIERGFSPTQRTTSATLTGIVAASSTCRNPAVIVIGEVVALGGELGMSIPQLDAALLTA